VFPAGIDGTYFVNVPFDPSYPLENYTRRIEQIHAAAVDVHGDTNDILKPAGAILGQLSRVNALAVASEHAQLTGAAPRQEEPNTTAAKAGLVQLARRLQREAQHVSRQLRSRAKRIDMLTELLDQLAQGVDISAVAEDLSASVKKLLDPTLANDAAPGNHESQDTLLMWSSTLRSLLLAQPAADAPQAPGHAAELTQDADSQESPLERLVNALLTNQA
jgi:hypothetical protein